MNLSPRWVDDLKGSGIEAQHWSAIGRADAPDPEILEYAARPGLILLTQDLDFSAILAATGAATPSVVQIRSENLDPRIIAPSVVRALDQLAADLADGALVSVDPARTRLTVLPLTRPPGAASEKIELSEAPVVETRDLDENSVLDVDGDGNICAITIEHASTHAGVPHFSYEQVLT